MSANLIVGKDPTGNKVPVAVDAAGKLQIGGVQLDNLNVNTDQIEAKQDTTNAILTTTAADVAAIKSPLSGVTQTSASGKVGLDVNIIAGGGGGGGGGASAAYNATLPTYTSGASTTLQTDVNGRLITTQQSQPLPTGAATSANQTTANTSLALIDQDIGNVADAVATSDTGTFSLIALTKRLLGKFTALTDGTQVATVNNAASQVYNYTATGAIAANTVLIGPIDCGQFREISLHVVSWGTGGTWRPSISNDGTNWTDTSHYGVTGNQITPASNNTASGSNFYAIPTHGAKFLRIYTTSAQTSGTATLVAYASQQATPKLYQVVSLGLNPTITPRPLANSGFAIYHTLISAASTNATSLSTGTTTVGTLYVTNTSASFKYLKLFNLSAAPTVGTSTPVLNLPIPPNSTIDFSASYAGVSFTSGLSYAITGGSALLDATAVAAGDVIINITRN